MKTMSDSHLHSTHFELEGDTDALIAPFVAVPCPKIHRSAAVISVALKNKVSARGLSVRWKTQRRERRLILPAFREIWREG